jgi:serine/threonine protein phosphatase PrpC
VLLRQPDLVLRTEQSIRLAMKQLCSELEARQEIDIALSGSTCVFVLRIDSRLFCVNIGDSRVIIGRRNKKTEALELSVDHTFEDADERSRVLAAGGLVRSLPGQ